MERIINVFYRHTPKKITKKVVFLSLKTFKIDHPVEDEQ